MPAESDEVRKFLVSHIASLPVSMSSSASWAYQPATSTPLLSVAYTCSCECACSVHDQLSLRQEGSESMLTCGGVLLQLFQCQIWMVECWQQLCKRPSSHSCYACLTVSLGCLLMPKSRSAPVVLSILPDHRQHSCVKSPSSVQTVPGTQNCSVAASKSQTYADCLCNS